MVTFYTDFAAAYGTIWLLLLACALVSQSHIDAGWFGLIGFPILGLIYAFLRRPDRMAHRGEYQELQNRIAQLQDELRRLHKKSNAWHDTDMDPDQEFPGLEV